MENVRHHVRTIDLAGLRSNVAAIRQSVPEGTLLLAVVKADAYGHGAVQVAREALTAGASWLAVALVEEGVELREAGIEAPILVLGASSADMARLAAVYGITLTVCDADMVRDAEAAALACGKTCHVHLKLDTGMSRIGARSADEVNAVLNALAACPHVALTGAFTHFADADGDDLTFTRQQLERFKALTALLPEGILRHCANSAAIHRLLPEAAFDMVRMGISLYGYPPVATDCGVKPFMSWTTQVTYVKTIQPGDTVSYGRTFCAEAPVRIATIACGYGDGYHRAATGRAEVLIRGRRAPVVGRICMDQMMADVTDIPGVEAGDTVTLIGQDGNEQITADDVAAWAGTIGYEVLLAATGRVMREWTHAEV